MTEPEQPEQPEQIGRGRRRWPRVLAVLGLVGIALLFLLPPLAAPAVRGLVERTLADELGAEARIDELSFNLGGSVHVGGVALTHPGGRPLATVERIDASVGLLALLGGALELSLLVEGVELHAYQEADGTWTVVDMPPDARREPKPKRERRPGDEGTVVRGPIELRDARLVAHGAGGEVVISNIGAALRFDGPDQPARLEADAELAGGRLVVEARLPGDPELWAEPRGLEAEAELAFEPAVDLGQLATLTPGLGLEGGRFGGRGRVTVAPGLDLQAALDFAAEDLVLSGFQPGDGAAHIGRLALEGESEASPEGRIQRLTVRVDQALRLELATTLRDPGTPQASAQGSIQVEGDAGDLAELSRAWVAWREGLQLDGLLLAQGTFGLRLEEGSLAGAEADLDLGLADLQALDAVEGPIDLGPWGEQGLTGAIRVAYDGAARALELQRLRLDAGTVVAEGRTVLQNLDGESPAFGPTQVDLTADLDGLAEALQQLLEAGDTALGGSLRANLATTGGALLPLEGRIETRDLQVGLGETRLEIGSLVADLDGRLETEAGDLELEQLQITSDAITGTVSGRLRGLNSLAAEGPPAVGVEALRGDLTYVPDRVAALLGPWIPGELSGSEQEPCRFELDGQLTGFAAADLVAGLRGTVELGVGRYRQTGLDLGGLTQLELADGQATVTGDLRANGGALKLDGGLVLAAGSEGLVSRDARLVVDADQVAANSGLGPLLSYVHPAFASLDSLNQTTIGGHITCDVELRYEGELSAAALAGGWEALPKEPIQGEIRFALDEANLVGSPLFQGLLAKLDLAGSKEFRLRPITLAVRDGRLTYETPWEWTVRGAQTTFGGSIGLDRSLDLRWTIPITGEVVARNDFLKRLEGETIEIPIGGTITRPKIETDGLLTDLAKGVVRSELEQALDSLIGRASADGGDGPADLLKRADDLWDQGKKVEAAAVYKRIRSEHKVSLVYTLNRDRIKKRAAFKPEDS